MKSQGGKDVGGGRDWRKLTEGGAFFFFFEARGGGRRDSEK